MPVRACPLFPSLKTGIHQCFSFTILQYENRHSRKLGSDGVHIIHNKIRGNIAMSVHNISTSWSLVDQDAIMRVELLSHLTQRHAKHFTKFALLNTSYYTTHCFGPTNPWKLCLLQVLRFPAIQLPSCFFPPCLYVFVFLTKQSSVDFLYLLTDHYP